MQESGISTITPDKFGVKAADYLLVQSALAVTCCIILAISWHSPDYLKTQLYPLCVFQGLHFIWALWSWRRITGHYFSPYTLFFIAVQFFNGGDCLLEIFKLNYSGILGEFRDYVSEALINKSVALATAGMVCIHLGALLGAYRQCEKDKAKKPISETAFMHEKTFVKAFGWIFFSLGAIPALYNVLVSAALSFFGGYMSLYHVEQSYGFSNWLGVASLFCVPGLLMLFTVYSNRKIPALLFLCFSALLCSALLMGGDRGTMVMLFLATLWLFHSLVIKIPPKMFVYGTIAAFLVCPVVGQMREESGWDRFSPFILSEELEDTPNPLAVSLNTMGGSMRTIAYTMILVPEERDFAWGSGYLWSASTVFPNLFWAEHPALKHTNYSLWLTKRLRPKIAAIGGGVGFSLFAEMYLNFSWFGTPFACILLGFAVGNFSAVDLNKAGPLYYALAAILISMLPYFARSSSQNIMRPLFWFCIFPYCVFRLWQLHKNGFFADYSTKIKTHCYRNMAVKPEEE